MNSPHFEIILWKIYVGKIELSDKIINEIIQVKPTLYFGIIIFIIGHVFNLAMNGLGAFIHTTRLHFLEFFTKFYDGGGRGYVPFLAQRTSTYIKQEGGK